jgi:hypothetical protein
MAVQRNLSDRLRSRPGVEQLEDRWTPAVTKVWHWNADLLIECNDGNDTIKVVDNGTSGKGSIVVYANGSLLYSVPWGIYTITVKTGGGADTVEYQQTGPLNVDSSLRGRWVDIDLGNGNDKAKLTIQSLYNSYGFYDFEVWGRGGDDLIQATVTGKQVGWFLGLHFYGGDGSDQLCVQSSNALSRNTRMNVDLYGDNGCDRLDVQATNYLAPNSVLQLNLQGGLEADGLNVQYGTQSNPPWLDGTLRLHLNTGGNSGDWTRLLYWYYLAAGSSGKVEYF